MIILLDIEIVFNKKFLNFFLEVFRKLELERYSINKI